MNGADYEVESLSKSGNRFFTASNIELIAVQTLGHSSAAISFDGE